MKNRVSPSWQFLKEKQHIWKLIWFSVKSFHNTCFFRNYKKIKQACCSGKKILAGYSSSISGQIPMGCTAGWLILDCTFHQPKEETKLRYCPTPQDQTLCTRACFVNIMLFIIYFPLNLCLPNVKAKPIQSTHSESTILICLNVECTMHWNNYFPKNLTIETF